MRIWEKWDEKWKPAIESRMDKSLFGRWLVSHTVLAFFYGLFLFAYEIKFVREIISPIHPVLIAWAGALAIYDIIIRNIWKKVPYWIFIFLFTVSAGITTILTVEVGLLSGIKGVIFAVLPLYAFFPLCFLQEKAKRKTAVIASMFGGAVLFLAASLVALGLYAVRFGDYVNIGSMREFVGMRFYIPTDPTTGILLYGLYVDTNHAALFALAFASYGIYLLISGFKGAFNRKWKNIAACVFGALSAAVQLCYFTLANSRTGWLALIIGIFAVAFFASFASPFSRKKIATKVILSGMVATVTVTCVFFGMQILRDGVAKLPDIVDHVQESIQENDQTGQTSVLPGIIVTDKTPVNDSVTDKTPAEDSDHSDMELADPSSGAGVTFDKGTVSADGNRFVIWKEALQLFRERPVFGTNPSGNQYYAQKYQVGLTKIGIGSAIHNSFLDLLLDYGIVGFILAILFWLMCAVAVLRNRFTRSGRQSIFWYVAAFTIIVTLCASMTLSCTFINTTAMYFLMIVAASYLMADIQ